MSKTFRAWDVDQVWLLPPSVHDFVPAGHPAHLVRELVRSELDLTAILADYDEERGQPPYHPAMMVALLLYAFTQGLYASRRIANEAGLVAAVGGQALGDADLMRGVDRELAVVALDEAVPGLHDPAVGIGEVALRPLGRTAVRGARPPAIIHHARGRAGLGVPGRHLGPGLGLQSGFGRPDALQPRLLVGDPVGQLVATLLGAVLGVLGGVSGLGLGQPSLDFGRERRLGPRHPTVEVSPFYADRDHVDGSEWFGYRSRGRRSCGKR
jgi:hypothetical protein